MIHYIISIYIDIIIKVYFFMKIFLFKKQWLAISLIAFLCLLPSLFLINSSESLAQQNLSGEASQLALSEELGVEKKRDTIYIFSSPSCPHCQSAQDFFNNLQVEHNFEITVYDYELSKNIELVQDFYQQYSVPANNQGLVPAIFFDDQYFIGFNEQIGQQITAYFLEGQDESVGKKVKLPFLGEVDLLQFSLPTLAITLGIVDGFNVCSLGALVLILGLVMVLGSRKRILLMGGIFLLTTGLVYGILLFLWHQFFTLIAPFIRSMEILIGILSLIGGVYLLREFYKAYKSGPVCSSNNLMSRLTPKVEKIFKNKTNWFVLLGTVVLFAFIVTVVEFPCSAVVPVLFTSILVESGLSLNTSLAYISLFLLFYLLDEIIIFLFAVFTMKIKIVSPKFIIFFNLLAAAIFIFLGVYYLFGWLS